MPGWSDIVLENRRGSVLHQQSGTGLGSLCEVEQRKTNVFPATLSYFMFVTAPIYSLVGCKTAKGNGGSAEPADSIKYSDMPSVLSQSAICCIAAPRAD
jgi:hypothetical protein